MGPLDTFDHLKYTKTHEWIHDEGFDIIVIGITPYAASLLGDVVFVELPENGRTLTAGESAAVIESVKAAADVYAPVAGVITEANDNLVDKPECVSTFPLTEGWLWKMKIEDKSVLDAFMTADEYVEMCKKESH